MTTLIIGIDCATDPRKVGLAKGVLDQGQLRIDTAEQGNNRSGIAHRVVEWLSPTHPVLIALDAPLGWPETLGALLAGHHAGDEVRQEPNQLFRRETDRFIKAKTGKQPLDVGADRIARTAVSALSLLGQIRQLSGKEIPLAWTPDLSESAAIEVYPAGTLTAYNLPNGGYKDTTEPHRAVRAKILQQLPEWVTIVDKRPLLANADVLDAALCCISGADFLKAQAMTPDNLLRAQKEGWIWVRKIES